MNLPVIFKKKVTGKMVLTALFTYYIVFALFYMPFSPISKVILKNIPFEKVLDLQKHGYTTSSAYEFFESLGENGRADYVRNLWTADLLMPFLSALSSILLMSYCIKRINVNRRLVSLLIILPVGVILCDYMENILLTIAVSFFQMHLNGLIRYASLFTQLKWMGISATFFASLALVVVMIAQLIWRKNHKKQIS